MSIGVPGNVPYIITVGAMTDSYTPYDGTDDTLASFSAAGPTYEGFVKPDLVAPGGHMLALMPTWVQIAEEHPEFHDGGSYFVMSGTSQAAAVVSGLAALLLFSWLASGYQVCIYAAESPAFGGSVADHVLDQDLCVEHSGRGDTPGTSPLSCPDCWESGCPALVKVLAHGMGDPSALPSPSEDWLGLAAGGGTGTRLGVPWDSAPPLPVPPAERHPTERFCVLLN